MAHPFTQLSQDEQREQLSCADAWPLLSLSFNPAARRLLIAARHHAGRTDVFDVDLNVSALSASVMLWWWSVTRQLLPAEQSLLEEHLPGSWLSYRSALELLIDWAAGATETQRHELVRDAAQHCTPFGDGPIRGLDFRTLLEILSHVRPIKPVILRVPLLHWLSQWAAQHTGSPLRCPQIQAIQDGAGGPGGSPVLRPSPCPVSAQTWYQELRSREREGSITFPTAQTVLAAAETKAKSILHPVAAPRPPQAPAQAPAQAPPQAPALTAPRSALPTWEQFLEQAPHSGSQDILSLLDGLASVPDASASHVAGAVLIIIKDLHLPPKASQLLNLATTAALLVPAVKNAWLLCPEANKHRLRPELERLSSTVAAKFGSSLNVAAKNMALQAIQPHISANAARPGINWSSVALQLASTPSFPLTAYTALHSVVDAASFRQGINQLCQPTCLCTASDYQQLQERVKQLLPLVAETASYDWFLAGFSAPPIGPSAVLPAATAPLPSSGSAALAPLAAAQPLPTLALLPPPQPPSTSAPAPCAVRITGLQGGSQEAMTAALTLTLGVPVYVTAADSRRGWGVAVIPPAVHASLFASHHKRLLQHPDGWELSLTCRNESTGEPWRVGNSSLSDPPSQRPEAPRAHKRVRVESPASPHRRSPRLQEQARHVHKGPRAGRAVRGSLWTGHQERR